MKLVRLFEHTKCVAKPTTVAKARTACIGICAATFIVSDAFIVAQSERPAQFEAASIKENRGVGRARIFSFQPGGRFRAMNISVRTLIGLAYAPLGSGATWLPSFRIVGGPGWLDEKGFDVQAKADGPVTQETMRRMLGALVAERFALVWHRESRTMPTYSLVLDKKDGRVGQRLTLSKGPCAGNQVEPGVTNASLPKCADRFLRSSTRGLRIQLADVDMNMLAARLSLEVGREVTNDTGLEGRFDVDLEYTPGLLATAPAPGASSDEVSFFSAVGEQLGLKLRSESGAVVVMVIDAVSPLEPD